MSPSAHVVDVSALDGRSDFRGPRTRRRSPNIKVPNLTRVKVPLAIYDHDAEVWHVRLSRVVEDAKQGEYMGHPLRRLEEIYLDGTTYNRTYGGGRVTRDDRSVQEPMGIAAAQTKDIIDLGRMEQACIALVQAVDKAGADPSDEQQESFLRSYQALLAWRDNVTERLLKIDGAIDVASAKVRKAMQ